MFRNSQAADGQGGWSGSSSLRKRRLPYADSDQEDDEDDEAGVMLPTTNIKKRRTSIHPSAIDTASSLLASFPCYDLAMNAFISPPVTPTPLPVARRQNSDVTMEDLDTLMADSRPASQRGWDGAMQVPSFVREQSTASVTSMLDVESAIHRPDTPGIIMGDMTRLEVSPPSEIQSRDWNKVAEVEQPQPQPQQQQQQRRSPPGCAAGMATAGSKGRFTMGYRADCEKCRNRVPGHWAHPPTF